jgi:MFS family permease
MWSSGFRAFFAGQAISLTGSSVAPVALSLGVLAATGSVTELGIVLAAQTVPLLLFLLIGGATADRLPRRIILVLSSCGSGLAQAVVAGLFLTGHVNTVVIASAGFAGGVFNAFTGPALKGIVPQLVAVKDIHRANSLLSSVKNGAKIFGPSVGGVLVVLFGGGGALAVDAASFLCAAALFALIPVVPRPATVTPPAKARRQFLVDIREGWTTFRSLTWVWVVTISSGLMNLVQPGAWQVLGPEIASHRFGAAAWGVILSARGIGLFVFSLAMLKITARRYLLLGQTLSVLGALPLLALGLSNSLLVVMGAAVIAGLGFSASGITWDTSLQEHIPDSKISRVSSFDDLLSYVTVPLGLLVIGPLAQRLGQEQTMVWAAVIYVVVGGGSLLSRSVRQLPHGERASPPLPAPLAPEPG